MYIDLRIVAVVFLFSFFSTGCMKSYRTEVCVYGGSSAGVVAAYTLSQYGKENILIEPGNHLGGLSSNGLGATDIGNKQAVTGLARDFYRRVGTHYGEEEAWTFEPHVAEIVFEGYMKESVTRVMKGYRIKSVEKRGDKIAYILVEDLFGKDIRKIEADVFIDCSYEGDLMAQSGVSFTIGRESNEVYGETLNGSQFFDDKYWGDTHEMGAYFHQFPDSISPYVEEGNPASGYVWGITSADSLPPNGVGDSLLQAYNFRLCLTDVDSNKVEFSRPRNYAPETYELLRRVFRREQKLQKTFDLNNYLLIIGMPNGKTDVNNRGPLSTDFIGMNRRYPLASYGEREKMKQEHEEYIRGLLYFLSTDEGVPDTLKQQMRRWGWAKDEFADNNHFPHQLYIRESRRLIGEYVMTEHHCRRNEVVSDSIGLAAYNMDSHHCRRMVVNGMVKNEGDVQVWPGPPYPIAYRAITPKRRECGNLLVPVCLSASHIAYGSIRMEPVFMVLGQAAAVGAVVALNCNSENVQSVDVRLIQKELQDNPYGPSNRK